MTLSQSSSRKPTRHGNGNLRTIAGKFSSQQIFLKFLLQSDELSGSESKKNGVLQLGFRVWKPAWKLPWFWKIGARNITQHGVKGFIVYCFSKDNATSNDDVMMRGAVWIRLPVPMLTLSGRGRVSFTTAIPLFSRRGHNVWIFVLFSSWKGKKNYPYMLSDILWYDFCIFKWESELVKLFWYHAKLIAWRRTTQRKSCLNYPSVLLYGFPAFDQTFIGFWTASGAFFIVLWINIKPLCFPPWNVSSVSI